MEKIEVEDKSITFEAHGSITNYIEVVDIHSLSLNSWDCRKALKSSEDNRIAKVKAQFVEKKRRCCYLQKETSSDKWVEQCSEPIVMNTIAIINNMITYAVVWSLLRIHWWLHGLLESLLNIRF